MPGSGAYRRPSAEQLERANSRKRVFLDFALENDIDFIPGNRAKPFTGDLSPGCQACVNGTWSCLYLNRLCTRRCFYCPQDRDIQEERHPKTDDQLTFSSAKAYIEYLREFPFEGIAFSGGEPFLAFDLLVEYITQIRRVFGRRHYIWVYTNGDLVTKESCELLNDLGLDELRFNISGNKYSLERVEMAARHIDTVTVEIPVIPEDLELVKSSLEKLESIGVKHLNVHQLLMNEYNQEELADRNYSITNASLYKHGVPILESETAAFEILKHAVNIQSRVGINYCSRYYKAGFQEKGYRKRHAPFCRSAEDSITQTGYLRTLSICDSPEQVNRFRLLLSDAERARCRLEKEDGRERLIFPPQSLAGVLESDHYLTVDVTYYKPKIKPIDGEDTHGKQTITLGGSEVFPDRERRSSFKLRNPTAAIFFLKMFVENKGFEQARQEVVELLGIEEERNQEILEDIRSFYRQFEYAEYVPRNPPAYH